MEASPTAEDVTGAVAPRAFQVALTRPTDWKLACTIGHLSDLCQPSKGRDVSDFKGIRDQTIMQAAIKQLSQERSNDIDNSFE